MALFLLQMGYLYLPLAAHEALGIALFFAAHAHAVHSRAWFRSLARGHWPAARVLQTFGVVAVFACMTALMASGVAMSGVLHFSGLSAWAHEAHLAASHAALLTFGFHIGTCIAKGPVRNWRENALRTLAVGFWALWALYGAYAFARLNVMGYIIGAIPFFAVDDTAPFALTLIDYASVMATAAFVGFLIVRLFRLIRRQRSADATRAQWGHTLKTKSHFQYHRQKDASPRKRMLDSTASVTRDDNAQRRGNHSR